MNQSYFEITNVHEVTSLKMSAEVESMSHTVPLVAEDEMRFNAAAEKTQYGLSATSAPHSLGDPHLLDFLPPLQLKIILTSGLFILTVGFSLLPLKCLKLARRGPSSSRRKYKKIISLLSCFAGGVFLGACFLDLFPDVKETVEEALAKLGQDPKKFPIPEFIMIYGLFVVLLLEQVVTQYQEQGIGPALGGHGHSHGGPSASPPRGRTPEPDNPEEDEERPSDDAREKRPLLTPVPSPATANGYGTVLRSPRAEHRDFDGRVEAPVDVVNDSGSLDYSHAHARHQHSHGDGSTTVPNHHHHRHHHNEQLSDTHSALRSLLLLMALSLHSLFEGLALGLLKTNNDIVNIFSALIIHKLVMGFSLGLNLIQSELKLRAIVGSIILFSATSPVGAAIGMIIAEMYHTPLAQLISGGLQGVACGTFLYVTFFEVLPHEMNSGGNRVLKVLAIVLGFSFIAAMMVILPEN